MVLLRLRALEMFKLDTNELIIRILIITKLKIKLQIKAPFSIPSIGAAVSRAAVAIRRWEVCWRGRGGGAHESPKMKEWV